MFNIYITNLGKYNEGYLVGEWLELPATEEEINATLERICISGQPDKYGRIYEEYFITDFENDFNYSVNEYASLESLNEIAQELEDMEECDAEIVKALIADGEDFETALEMKDNACVYYNCSDMTDIAYEVVEETGLLSQIPESLQYYFDYEAYGRDLGFEGRYIFTDDGNCICIY